MEGHRSRPVDRELVDEAAVIVVMTASHRDQLEMLYPDASGKTFLLASFGPSGEHADIRDPIGLPADAYGKVRDEIAAALPGLVSFLESLELR